MSVERKYTEQMPFVGTRTQRDRIEAEAARTKRSIAAVIRLCIDKEFGLDDGEESSP